MRKLSRADLVIADYRGKPDTTLTDCVLCISIATIAVAAIYGYLFFALLRNTACILSAIVH